MEKPCGYVFSIKGGYMQGFLLLFIPFLFSCAGPAQQDRSTAQTEQPPAPLPGKVGMIPLPEGYTRIDAGTGDYAKFLRNIPLKKDKTVYLYNGAKKRNQQAQYAVLAIDAGNKVLQQCADAVMRIRAEYLFARKQFSDISFRFTNGFHCDYEHYAQGYRLVTRGNTCNWVKQKNEDYTYPIFRQYLDQVYAYAGTKSLHAQLRPVSFQDIAPGMVLIQTGNPYGHAVTVMDMARNPKTGDTIFLLSQSYMPAQDIHILRNPMNSSLSPWYSVRGNDVIATPEWTFTKEDLRSF